MSDRAPAPAGGEALGQHPDDRIEVVAGQRTEGPAAPHQIEERVLLPVLRCDLGDDLLGEHVERLLGNCEPVELAAANAVEERGALDEIVARERKQPPLGRPANGVAGAADPLQKGRNRARRTELADEIDIADVDPEFERGGRHQGFQFAPFQPLLGREPQLLRHAAVMGGDGALAETLRELVGDPFGHPAGVDEHQRRPMILDQFREAGIDLGPDLVRHHRFEGRTRHLDGQVAPALMAGVDDRNLRGGPAVRGGAGQEMGDGLNRILCCGEADPLEPVAAQRRQPLEREREMGAALVRRDGMDFVDDDRAGARQHGAPGFRAEQNVERLRRRHQDMRRAPAHLVALGRRRVAGAHPGADFDVAQARRGRSRSRMPASGASRLRWMSFDSALSGET